MKKGRGKKKKCLPRKLFLSLPLCELRFQSLGEGLRVQVPGFIGRVLPVVRQGGVLDIVENDNRLHRVIVQRAGLPRLLKLWNDLNYGNLIAGAKNGLSHEILAERQNRIHTELFRVLESGDTEAACRAIYDHYMKPMEKMKNAVERGAEG